MGFSLIDIAKNKEIKQIILESMKNKSCEKQKTLIYQIVNIENNK